jgi:hypothetical protein
MVRDMAYMWKSIHAVKHTFADDITTIEKVEEKAYQARRAEPI